MGACGGRSKWRNRLHEVGDLLIKGEKHTNNDERQIIGRSLREVREEQGLSLEQIEQAIAVHVQHVEALERGDYEAFPDPLWARGSLILYADHLGMYGERLADELFPLQRPSVPERFLRQHWRTVLAVLSTLVALVAIMSAATIVAPYNQFTESMADVLQEVAPDMFLGSEPQRVVILGVDDSVTNKKSSISVVGVAEDGLSLLSIPRDTVTEIPGHGRDEIGEAVDVGGPSLMRRTVAAFTGTEVQFYCVIKPDGIKEIVRSANGVTIDVPGPVSGRATPGGPVMTLRPGRQILDGDQALVYLQGNDLPTDAERAKRQQSFLYTMFRQALGPSNLFANPAALRTGTENVETNMSSVQMIQLAGRIRKLETSDAPPKTATLSSREEAPSAQ